MRDERRSPADRKQLIDSLWRDARREADGILNQARAEAIRTEDNTRHLNRTVLREALETAEHESRNDTARILNRARETSRRTVLDSRYSVLEENLARITGMLDESGVLDAKLREAFPTLLSEAVEKISEKASIQVRVHPGDEAAARRILQDKVVDADVIGDPEVKGGALVSVNGSFEILDNTVHSRLENIRENPPLGLFRELFGGGTADS